jgi:hypothetical protein
MKSHLGYHFMLSHALGSVPGRPAAATPEGPKNVLLVSLRDDVDAARNTLARLIEQQQIAGPGADADAFLSGLLAADRLEILYNWPGCVTPDEFFHRVYVALARRRHMRTLADVFAAGDRAPAAPTRHLCEGTPGRDTAEIVVLNGLDHLDVKFPLCAAERVFVPALISLFRCFKVCSVVISAEDKGGGSADIRPLSDLVLEFGDASIDQRTMANVPAPVAQASAVSAARVPAGQIGGRRGILGREAAGRMDFWSVP